MQPSAYPPFKDTYYGSNYFINRATMVKVDTYNIGCRNQDIYLNIIIILIAQILIKLEAKEYWMLV